jgi:hypothetical protein
MRGYGICFHRFYIGVVMKKYISITEDRFLLTESEIRQAEVDKHVAAFLRKGGKIQQIPIEVSGYNPKGEGKHAFVINTKPPATEGEVKDAKRTWKEYKYGTRTAGV